MSSLGFIDKLKLTYKVLEFKFEQRRLTTNQNSIVKTTKGSIKGVKRLTIWGDLYHSFERIPFAKPPLGDLRFKAPQSPEPWDTILDCTRSGEAPLQINSFITKYKGTEDCLYLNVYSKNITPEKAQPVLVWIYGGGFQVGEATRDMYSPDYLMTKDVVLVTISYRLGALGFLSLDDPEVDIPGNAGIKDQILGLKWVHDNISNFGGDPNNITLFGESAGGASTHLCMLSEQTKGLFHKAIIMSGSALCPWARSPSNNWAYRFAKKLGYKGEEKASDIYKFLKDIKGTDMVDAAASILNKDEKHHRILFAFGPVVEPYKTEHSAITEHPCELMKKSWSNNIPLMIGGTSFEGLLFHPEVIRRPATLNEVVNCKNMLPIDIDVSQEAAEEYGLQLKKTYFGDEECSPTTIMKFLELSSYREFWHPIYRTIKSRLENATAPTYLYRFDFDSREGNCIRNILCGRDVKGVCHGDELGYLFLMMFSYRPERNSAEHLVIRTLVDIWTTFATTSKPQAYLLGNLDFKPVDNIDNLKCLNIANNPDFITLPELDKLKIWNNFYLQGKL